MTDTLTFDLSGIRLRVRGIPEDDWHRTVRWWRSFPCGAAEGYDLDATVDLDAAADPAPASFAGAVARFVVPGGAARAHASGTMTVGVSGGTRPERVLSAFNLVLAGLAWSLPTRGAAILHGAAAVIEGRAFLLIGPEGSGKTTWAELAQRSGARVLSDDLVFVDTSNDPVEALATPVRADHQDPAGPGRWPLAAVLVARHGSPSGLAPLSRMRARSMLVANLPFVAPAIETSAAIRGVVERLATGVPARTLTFARDLSFIDVLRAFEDVS